MCNELQTAKVIVNSENIKFARWNIRREKTFFISSLIFVAVGANIKKCQKPVVLENAWTEKVFFFDFFFFRERHVNIYTKVS